MNENINGIVLTDSIAQKISFLQSGYSKAIVEGLDNAIGYLLENSVCCNLNPKDLLNVLSTLHNARTELLGLIPGEQEGGAQ